MMRASIEHYVGGLERQTENPTINLVDRLAVTLAVPRFELLVFPPKGASALKPLPKGRKVSLPPRKI